MAIEPIKEGKKILEKAETGIKSVEKSKKIPKTPKVATKPMKERKKILQAEILMYVKDGWQVSSQFDTSAQLTRVTGPSLGVACLLALLLILPALLYLIFYKGKETVYIEVDEQGEVKITENN